MTHVHWFPLIKTVAWLSLQNNLQWLLIWLHLHILDKIPRNQLNSAAIPSLKIHFKLIFFIKKWIDLHERELFQLINNHQLNSVAYFILCFLCQNNVLQTITCAPLLLENSAYCSYPVLDFRHGCFVFFFLADGRFWLL